MLVTSDLKDEQIELREDEHDISVVDTHAFSDDQVCNSPSHARSRQGDLRELQKGPNYEVHSIYS